MQEQLKHHLRNGIDSASDYSEVNFGVDSQVEGIEEFESLALERARRAVLEDEYIDPADPDPTTDPKLRRLHEQRAELFIAVDDLFDEDSVESKEAILDTEITIKDTIYRLKKLIGQGSFGAAFIAEGVTENPDDSGEVVLKISRPFDRNDQFLYKDVAGQNARMLIREAAILFRLSKGVDVEGVSNVPDYFDAQFIPNPDDKHERIAVLVMEHIKGVPLSTAVAASGSLRREPRTLLNTAIDLADAVAFLQSYGVNHNDIKPGNIIFADNGRARLIDFGLASYNSLTEDADIDASVVYRHNRDGSRVGTKNYLPDDQTEPSSQARDIYALGRTIQNMLFGNSFRDQSAINQIVSKVSGPLQELYQLTQEMTAEEPVGRPTIQEISVRLKAIQGKL